MRDVELRKIYLAISILNIEILDLYRKKANIEILRYTTNRAGLCQKQKVSQKRDFINSAIHAKHSKALAEEKSIAKMQFFHICDTKPGFQGPDPLAQAATDPELLNLTTLSKPDKKTVPLSGSRPRQFPIC